MPQDDLIQDSAYDTFISYSSKNKNVADALCHYLEERKIRCWMAPRDILPGQEYAEAIIQAMNEVKVFILVCSNCSLSSQWVRKETNAAVSRGKIIIPFRIDDCSYAGTSMELYLNDRHWIDAVPDLDKAFGKVVTAVIAIIGTKTSNQSEVLKVSEKEFQNSVTNDQLNTPQITEINHTWLLKRHREKFLPAVNERIKDWGDMYCSSGRVQRQILYEVYTKDNWHFSWLAHDNYGWTYFILRFELEDGKIVLYLSKWQCGYLGTQEQTFQQTEEKTGTPGAMEKILERCKDIAKKHNMECCMGYLDPGAGIFSQLGFSFRIAYVSEDDVCSDESINKYADFFTDFLNELKNFRQIEFAANAKWYGRLWEKLHNNKLFPVNQLNAWTLSSFSTAFQYKQYTLLFELKYLVEQNQAEVTLWWNDEASKAGPHEFVTDHQLDQMLQRQDGSYSFAAGEEAFNRFIDKLLQIADNNRGSQKQENEKIEKENLKLYSEEEQTLVRKLDDLFCDWRQAMKKYYDEHGKEEWFGEVYSDDWFVPDGFYPQYLTKQPKILFIGRESYWLTGVNYIDLFIHHYLNGTTGSNEKPININREKFHKLLLEVSYGLIHGKGWYDTPYADKICANQETFNKTSFAFMNLSKFSNENVNVGKKDTDWNLVEESLRMSITQERNFILDEIKLLDPDLIVTMNFQRGLLERVFGQTISDCLDSNGLAYKVTLNKKEVLLVNSYHFSSRNINEKEGIYDPIKNAWEKFKNNSY